MTEKINFVCCSLCIVMLIPLYILYIEHQYCLGEGRLALNLYRMNIMLPKNELTPVFTDYLEIYDTILHRLYLKGGGITLEEFLEIGRKPHKFVLFLNKKKELIDKYMGKKFSENMKKDVMNNLSKIIRGLY